ncbi:MAG: NYN domain-containing protein [Candidatus Krumholzibacteriia bacterium]
MRENGRERNLALFIDFDNVALGARDSRMRFDVRLLLQRVLEKGKVVVKRAYADWHHYKEHMTPLHESAIELIEVPTPRISGKNSADIRLVVDAIDLCYAKTHIDTFVIVSGDSDFSPLVSKLRENDKRVIGIGVRSSTSNLLIGNCDEFLFYDDIYHSAVNKLGEKVGSVPENKRQLFDFLIQTTQSLLQESRGVLYSSLVKDTMKRKQPDFNEGNFGFGTFGDLLEEAHERGLLEVERDSRAGGTLVVLGLGKGEVAPEKRTTKPRRRRRGGSRRDEREPRQDDAPAAASEAAADVTAADKAAGSAVKTEGKTEATAETKTEAKAEAETDGKPDAKPTRATRGARRRSAKTAATTAAEPATDATAARTAKKAAKKTAKKTTKKAAKKTTRRTTKKTTAKGDPDR